MNNLDTIKQDIASLPPDAQKVIFDLVEVFKKSYSIEEKSELLSENQKEINEQSSNLNEVEKQLQLGREFMKDYHETFKDLAK